MNVAAAWSAPSAHGSRGAASSPAPASASAQNGSLAQALSQKGADLLSRLSDDTRQMLDRLMASGGISAKTAASAIDYFAKLKNNQDVADTMPTPAAAATAGGLDEALARLETGLKEGGDTLTRDIDAYRRASAAYRRESLDTLHKRLAAGMQGYKLEELSAGAAIRNTPLGDALARDAGVDLSRGAL
ncbi:hypothetical protein [Niveispirillum sp.]|uniref:hypothetical protein n=1 Tax=Niveispirillum sp. TaxID=1917217 RepID=UPI001B6E44C0|nr:hypothetical protein [Niveispirillum sp.]MBP7334735.1 hypothetical protein [Niveispirillum sp.]